MTVRNGIILSEATMGDQANNMVPVGNKSTQLDYTETYDANQWGYLFPIRVGQGYTSIGKTRNGFIPFTYGDEILFWRIWFEPYTIDAGFIVEDKGYDVKIWNAYLDQTASISAISGVSVDGTTIAYDPVPITIGKFGDEWITITVLGEGPPLQDTTYTFTVNAVDYDTLIEGIRVAPMPWEPDWESKVKIEMHFNTVIERNTFFVEQRRPLRYTPTYRISFRIIASGLSGQKLKQTMTYGHDKVFGIPIHTEQAYPSEDFNLSATINTSNDLTDLWNLNNQAAYIVIIDHSTLQAEIKELSQVNANSIVCSLPVSDTFTWQTSIVYPIVMCTAEGLSLNPQSDTVFTGDLAFKQYERASGV